MRVLPLNVVPIPQKDWGPEGGEEWREEGGGENKAERKCERGRGYQVMGTEYSAIQTSHELVGQNSWWQGRKKRCVEIEKWVLVERERGTLGQQTERWMGREKKGRGRYHEREKEMNLRTLTLQLKREATFACNCLCSCTSLHDNLVVIIFFHFYLLLQLASSPSFPSAWSH